MSAVGLEKLRDLRMFARLGFPNLSRVVDFRVCGFKARGVGSMAQGFLGV